MTNKAKSLPCILLVFLLFSTARVQSATLSDSRSTIGSNSLRTTDVNGDGIVNILDVYFVAGAYGSYAGHPRWNLEADIDGDGVVNVQDIALIAKDFGKIERAPVCYDFDEPLNWTVVEGTWDIRNGLLDGFSNAEGLVYNPDIAWENCTLTAKVKIAADSPEAEAAFCVGFVDPRNFYWAGLGCWGHKISISKMVNNVPQELIFRGDRADVAKDVWYIVSIKISGGAIRLYVDDVLELVVNDSTLTSGKVGIRLWDSHVYTDYVTVSGFASTPSPSKPEIYRGFACGGIFEGLYTREHFSKIRQWGFNCVLVPFFWAYEIEPDKNAVGFYDEQNLQRLRRFVDLALSEGLEVILSGRVCYDPVDMPYWAGWATHDYVNMQDGGLNRYARFWEMMVQRFPDCMYCLWHFPYHMQDVDSVRVQRFYEVTFPTLLSAVRKHTQNTVVFVPIHQGITDLVRQDDSDYYLTAQPYSDTKLIYGFNHMVPWSVVDGNWDYDVQSMDAAFAGIKRWRQTFNLPMMSVEYAPLSWVRGEPVDESRLACLDESLKRMSMYNVGWMYWHLSLTAQGGDNVLADITNFKPNAQILSLLQQWS